MNEKKESALPMVVFLITLAAGVVLIVRLLLLG